MIEFHIATADEVDDFMSVRLEMLKVVNNLAEDYQFDKTVVECSHKYFLEGNQTTIFAKDGKKMVRCSVYDVRKGTFIKSFDPTFDTAYQYTNELLRFIGFDEEKQCFYAEDRTDYHTYRFDFGA